MSNKGMKLKPKSLGHCPSCNRRFRKERARETYCSIHCAVWPRIAKGDPEECWPWTGGLVVGYGAGTFQKQRYRVSRVVLSEKLGRELKPGECALHRCDNPRCCNPSHLFVGSHKDNMVDKCQKGRWRGGWPAPKGSKHGKAKLSEADVIYIWNNRAEGPTKLGKRFGVDKTVVHKVLQGTTWGHLTSTL